MRRRVVGIALFMSAFASTVAAEDLQKYVDRCQNVQAPKVKLERCLALLQGGKISKDMLPAIYSEVAFAWSQLGDYSRAIDYTHKQLEITLENMKAQTASGKASAIERQIWPRQISHTYSRLGQYLALARLSQTTGSSDQALSYLKAELSSYDAAISYNHENHGAYSARAEVHSLMCNGSQANADLDAALRIARAADDDRASREYKFKVLPGCVPEWRSR